MFLKVWVYGSPPSEPPPEIAERVRMSRPHHRPSESESLGDELGESAFLVTLEEILGLLNFGKCNIDISSSLGRAEILSHLHISVSRYRAENFKKNYQVYIKQNYSAMSQAQLMFQNSQNKLFKYLFYSVSYNVIISLCVSLCHTGF